MQYEAFCADFGPFNLGMTHRFGEMMKSLLLNPKLSNSKLILYCKTAQVEVTNAIYLLGSFLVAHLGATPQQAWAPFSKIEKCPCLPYRDCTWVKPSPYDLHMIDCWSGLAKAMRKGLYSPADFNKEEYFYYDDPKHGDMHEVVKGKFFAFKGPTEQRKEIHPGQFTFMPSDYCHVFRYKGVRTVVRLTHKEYDRQTMVSLGFHHHDLYFADCTPPPDSIVDRFLRIAETSQGAIAVHCLAGLGRTGTLIALWMMKHLEFTADEAMAWLRICRPGSVIGPQQRYLKKQEERMRALGRKKATGLGVKASEIKELEAQNAESEREAEELSEMVAKASEHRDAARITGVRQSSLIESKMLKAGAAVDATGDDCQCDDLKRSDAGKEGGSVKEAGKDAGKSGEEAAREELVSRLREESGAQSSSAPSRTRSVPAPLMNDSADSDPAGGSASDGGASPIEARAPALGATIGKGRRAGLARTSSIRASKVASASDSEAEAKDAEAEVANGRRKGLTRLRQAESEPSVVLTPQLLAEVLRPEPDAQAEAGPTPLHKTVSVARTRLGTTSGAPSQSQSQSFRSDTLTDAPTEGSSASQYASVKRRVPSHFVKKGPDTRSQSSKEGGEEASKPPSDEDKTGGEEGPSRQDSFVSVRTEQSGASHASSVKPRVATHWVKKRSQSPGKERESEPAMEGTSEEGPSRQESFLSSTSHKSDLYATIKSRVPSHFVRSQSPRDHSPRKERPHAEVEAYHAPVGKAKVPSHFVKKGSLHRHPPGEAAGQVSQAQAEEVTFGLNAPAGCPPSEK